MKILYGGHLLLQYKSLFKIDGNPLWSIHTYSLFNSYSKLMKMLTGATHLPQYTFLIQFLFKIDENPLWSILPPQLPQGKPPGLSEQIITLYTQHK